MLNRNGIRDRTKREYMLMGQEGYREDLVVFG